MRTPSPCAILARDSTDVFVLTLAPTAAVSAAPAAGSLGQEDQAGATPGAIPLIAPPATPAISASPTFAPVHENALQPLDVEAIWKADIPLETARSLVPQITVAPDGTLWAIDGATNRFLLVAPDGSVRETWGEAGSGDGQFAFRRDDGAVLGGIAFAPDGGFYVADAQNGRVQQFAPDRGFVRAWGEPGTGEGQFLEPIGVNVAPDGSVYVIDVERDDVQVFTAEGAFLRVFGEAGNGDGQLEQPGQGAFDAAGNFWIADTGNGRIQQFDQQGDHLLTVDSSRLGAGVIDQPEAVAIDRAGRVYVTDRDSQRIQVFQASGRWLVALGYNEIGGGCFDADCKGTVVTPYRDPAGIAFDVEGNLYVVDADPETASLRKFGLIEA